MACSFTDVNPASDEKGNTISKNGQIAFRHGDKIRFEEELLGEDGVLSIVYLRDRLLEKDMMSQDTFNDFLEYLFLNSMDWYSQYGATGRRRLKNESPAFHFFNDDQKVFKQMRKQHPA